MKRRTTMKTLFGYLKSQVGYVVLSFAGAFAGAVISLYIPLLTGRAVDQMIGAGQVEFAVLTDLIQKIVLCIVMGFFAQWLTNYCNNAISFGVSHAMREDFFSKMKRIALARMDQYAYGDLVNRMISDVEQVSDGLLLGANQLFSGLVTIVGTLIFMLLMDVRITLVVIYLTPISLLAATFISKKTYHLFQKQSKLRAQVSGIVNESVSGEKLIQAYGQEDIIMEEFARSNHDLKVISRKATFYSSLVNPGTRFINALVYMAVALVGAISALRGLISVGQLTVFLSYANQYTKPFNEITGVVTELQNALACAGRIFDFLEEEEEQEEAMQFPGEVKGNVTFENVSFSYEPDKPLIQNMNIEAREGQLIAIVGPTGCGKTTLINLLMRFYEVDDGRILIDGKDIADYSRQSLRAQMCMVLQDSFLIQGTIRDNISFGLEQIRREEIVNAAKAAYADEFIMQLPQGYDTVLDFEADTLSQGQKQLLCIARAMLHSPAIMILDEATSSVDTLTEQKIQKAFHKLMKGRTSFVVAHRLSTIMNADCILVMNDGKIVERGTHEQLLKKDGFYRKLYESQFDAAVAGKE
ncbi:ABC transporter ATP-binding protein [Eubacterium oxidoreducens]|uniref:ATP-binding cassette, subfamily B n=1 Tax=Eubacterium oxidoreducens TaxID=1732 RepID=A0A1G6BW95_EUBOX|nr:ABC transporter ATP-binding protein [Eubacterium oxidoreducens]SDB24874.1 ATP-binding cassette, subfamily B [Eubacterium oxidoreducens]